jgi:hypothetical protein
MCSKEEFNLLWGIPVQTFLQGGRPLIEACSLVYLYPSYAEAGSSYAKGGLAIAIRFIDCFPTGGGVLLGGKKESAYVPFGEN